MPKYIGPTPKPAGLLVTFGSAARLTLTEDMLSAIKVSLGGGEGWAVLGTTVSSFMVSAILKRGTAVNVWLDPDAAGRRGAGKIIKQLRAYGVECRDIVSGRDPKLHTRAEIKEYLT
jgi:hypothetical protein